MIVDLPALIRSTGTRRRDVTLPPIQTTRAQARDLYRLYLPMVAVWEDGSREMLLPEYERSLNQALATDSAFDLQTVIAIIEGMAVSVTASFTAAASEWASRLSQWHLQRLIGSLRYATNVDLTYTLGPASSAQTVEDFLARNTALIRDVAKEISEATGLGRKRSLRIASDQTVKLSSALDRQRQLELGLDQFKWVHSEKVNFRPEHKARNGKIYSWTEGIGISDPPGALPFCGCKAQTYVPLMDEEADI